jgi:hypothetical protein
MSATSREFLIFSHGLILGVLFLLAFAGGLVSFYGLRAAASLTVAELKERVWRLKWGTGAMAVVAWLLVISGTYIIYPLYRAKPPEGVADLSAYPRSFLLADPSLAILHTFGMEWKEHIAWFAPILATAVFYIVLKYGPQLSQDDRLRRMAFILFILAFAAAAIAGVLGGLIADAAPVL